MKIVRFVENERQSYGVVSLDGIVDAGARVGEKYADIADLLAAGAPGVNRSANKTPSNCR